MTRHALFLTFILLLAVAGAIPAAQDQAAPAPQAPAASEKSLLAERVPSWDERKQAYVQAQSGRQDLAAALREGSERHQLVLAPGAADLLLTEALSAEAYHAGRAEEEKRSLDDVHAKTALALEDFLADLAGKAGTQAELQPFSRYLARRWGQGALGTPRRNVYGRLEVAVVPGTTVAEIWVDGRYVTTSDRRPVLLEGSHAVRTKDPARDRGCQETVDILGGRTRKISCVLQ